MHVTMHACYLLYLCAAKCAGWCLAMVLGALQNTDGNCCHVCVRRSVPVWTLSRPTVRW